MRTLAKMRNIGTALLLWGVVLFVATPLFAQETGKRAEGKPAIMHGPGMMGKGRMAEMHKMHEEMEAMQQEMTRNLQGQIAALREHAKRMEEITDEKELLAEMKKHMQMTDEVLGTLLENHEKMHARMKAHHEQMRTHMEQKQQSSEEEQSEEHESHHQE